MAGIDYFFIVVALLCILICTLKGFVDSFFDKAAPVAAIVAAFLFFRSFTFFISKFIANQLLCTIVSFLSIFVIVFIVVKIIQKTLGAIFEDKILGSLNHALGFLFGIVEAVAYIGLILFVISAQPFFDGSNLIGDSIFYKAFRSFLGIRFVPVWEKHSVQTTVACFGYLFSGVKLV